MTKVATYLYAVVKSARAPAMGRPPQGLPGAERPRMLRADRDLWLAVSSAPLEQYGEAAIERGLKNLEWVSSCAMAHEAVVEHLGKNRALIPMKLFTLFHDDDRAIQHIKKQGQKLRAVLKRVSGAQEWGVRIRFDEVKALRASVAANRAAAPKSGADFLRGKKVLRDQAAQSTSVASQAADQAHQELARLAKHEVRREPASTAGTTPLVLDAAFLVASGRTAAFRRAVKGVQGKLGDSFDLTLTGPWPPYNFISEAQ